MLFVSLINIFKETLEMNNKMKSPKTFEMLVFLLDSDVTEFF